LRPPALDTRPRRFLNTQGQRWQTVYTSNAIL